MFVKERRVLSGGNLLHLNGTQRSGVQLLNKIIYNECARFEVLTALTMKNVVFCDIKPQIVPHRRHITH
jgi:hypothetical protein